MVKNFNIAKRGSWAVAEVDVRLLGGIGLRDSLALTGENNKVGGVEARIYGQKENIPLNNGVFNLKRNGKSLQ